MKKYLYLMICPEKLKKFPKELYKDSDAGKFGYGFFVQAVFRDDVLPTTLTSKEVDSIVEEQQEEYSGFGAENFSEDDCEHSGLKILNPSRQYKYKVSQKRPLAELWAIPAEETTSDYIVIRFESGNVKEIIRAIQHFESQTKTLFGKTDFDHLDKADRAMLALCVRNALYATCLLNVYLTPLGALFESFNASIPTNAQPSLTDIQMTRKLHQGRVKEYLTNKNGLESLQRKIRDAFAPCHEALFLLNLAERLNLTLDILTRNINLELKEIHTKNPAQNEESYADHIEAQSSAYKRAMNSSQYKNLRKATNSASKHGYYTSRFFDTSAKQALALLTTAAGVASTYINYTGITIGDLTEVDGDVNALLDKFKSSSSLANNSTSNTTNSGEETGSNDYKRDFLVFFTALPIFITLIFMFLIFTRIVMGYANCARYSFCHRGEIKESARKLNKIKAVGYLINHMQTLDKGFQMGQEADLRKEYRKLYAKNPGVEFALNVYWDDTVKNKALKNEVQLEHSYDTRQAPEINSLSILSEVCTTVVTADPMAQTIIPMDNSRSEDQSDSTVNTQPSECSDDKDTDTHPKKT